MRALHSLNPGHFQTTVPRGQVALLQAVNQQNVFADDPNWILHLPGCSRATAAAKARAI
jgi:hypothetical protein